MNPINLKKLRQAGCWQVVAAGLLAFMLAACSSSGSDSESPEPPKSEEPIPTEPTHVEMTQGEAYDVAPNDRLVNTSPEPARVRVRFGLDETTGEDSASVTLLEGEANLYR